MFFVTGLNIRILTKPFFKIKITSKFLSFLSWFNNPFFGLLFLSLGLIGCANCFPTVFTKSLAVLNKDANRKFLYFSFKLLI